MSVELVQIWGSDDLIARCARMSYGKFNAENKTDDKLIAALRRKGHWTPFSHAGATFHIRAPLFIARQLGRHTVGFTWSEKSGRYADADTECYMPSLNVEGTDHWQSAYVKAMLTYQEMVNHGIPREQARALLPQGMMTNWIWSGNIAAWQRLFYWRLDKAAQKETRDIVQQIHDLLVTPFPLSLGVVKYYSE